MASLSRLSMSFTSKLSSVCDELFQDSLSDDGSMLSLMQSRWIPASICLTKMCTQNRHAWHFESRETIRIGLAEKKEVGRDVKAL